MNDETGRIITFYSYKGGTGRTLALANVGWILASAGKRVLLVDWDLEAPGLHRYLRPFLPDPEMADSPGLIEIITEFAYEALRGDAAESDVPWYEGLADLGRYAVSLRFPGERRTPFQQPSEPPRGTVDFLGAGRQDDGYASRVAGLDWLAFYERLGGGAFLDRLAQRARQDYDYVLIDSRTGVSDTAGICSVQLPDTLAVFFTLNIQSIEGAASVAESAFEQRRDHGAFRVYPVATRIELAEQDKLEAARARAHQRFARLMLQQHATAAEVERYWLGAEVLYQPFYAYEELLATIADKPGRKHSMLTAMEHLSSLLTGGEVVQLSQTETDRLTALEAYGHAQSDPAPGFEWDFYLYYPSPLREYAGELFEELRRAGARVFWDRASVKIGQSRDGQPGEALDASRHVVLVLSDAPMDEQAARELSRLLELTEADPLRSVIPVFTSPESMKSAPRSLRSRQGVLAYDAGGVGEVATQLLASLGARPVDSAAEMLARTEGKLAQVREELGRTTVSRTGLLRTSRVFAVAAVVSAAFSVAVWVSRSSLSDRLEQAERNASVATEETSAARKEARVARAEASAAQTELADWRTKVGPDAEKSIASLRDSLLVVELSNQNLKDQLRDANARVAQQKAVLEARTKELAEAQQQLDEGSAKLKTLEGERDESNRRADKAETQVTSLNKSLRSAEKDLERTRTLWESTVKALEELRGELRDRKQEISEIKTKAKKDRALYRKSRDCVLKALQMSAQKPLQVMKTRLERCAREAAPQ